MDHGWIYKSRHNLHKRRVKSFMTLYYLPALLPQLAETLHSIQQNSTKLGLFAPKLTLGDHVPTGPQHKDCDSTSSHSAGAEILLQRPSRSICATATSVALCVAACLMYSNNCSVASPALSALIFCCVLCRLSNFS